MVSFLLSFVAFLASFFSLSEHLVGFILVGKVFRKAFRILGLDERKSGWVVEQDFHGTFQVNVMVTMLQWSTDSLSGLDKNTFQRNSTLLEKRKQSDAFSSFIYC